jgi:hypothetical protein
VTRLQQILTNMESSASIITTSSSTDHETVTLLTAQSLNPGNASAILFNREGLIYSLWRVVVYLLLEVFGLKSKQIDENYENVNLDEVGARGRFPYRPSDLFLKVPSIFI